MVSTVSFDPSAGWGTTINGIFGKKNANFSFAESSQVRVSKAKTIAICAIGFILGAVALAVAFAALAVLFSIPVVGPFLAAAAVGSIVMGVTTSSAALIAAGAVFGALAFTGVLFGSAAANALRKGDALPRLD